MERANHQRAFKTMTQTQYNFRSNEAGQPAGLFFAPAPGGLRPPVPPPRLHPFITRYG